MVATDVSCSGLDFVAYEADPLGRFILGRLKLPAVAVAGACLMAYVLSGGLAVVFLTITRSADPETLRDLVDSNGWYGILFGIMMFPVVGGFYAWVSVESGRLLSQLYRGGALADPPDVGLAVQLHRSSVWPRLAFAAIVVFLGLWWGSGELADSPRYANKVWNLFTLPAALVAWYLICMIAARQITTMRVLWHLFGQGHLLLRPLQPDKAGGLSPVSRYTMALGYFIAGAGTGLALLAIQAIMQHSFDRNYALHAAIGLYVVLSPSVFFGTLGAAHNAMAETKDRLLSKISQYFDREFDRAVAELDSDVSALRLQLTRMEELDKLYRLTERFPVWPFDTGTVRRFFALVSAPLAAVAVARAVDALASIS